MTKNTTFMIREATMNYITSTIPDQIVHDIPNGETSIPAIVTHVIDIEGEVWGCAYPVHGTAIKVTRPRKRAITIGTETIEYTMGEDEKIWVRTTIEGGNWMAVRRVYDREWIREGGQDDWYLERLMELGVSPDEVLYPRRKRPVAPHTNPIPVPPVRPERDVIKVRPPHTPENLLLHLADSNDEHMRALFENGISYDTALAAVKRAFPDAILTTGRYDARYKYIAVTPVIVTPKKRRSKKS